MPSITSWTRIEPRTRRNDVQVGLEGRLYDAAWLLGIQLQLGELDGSWGGSPVVAQIKGEAAQLGRFHPGSLTAAQSAIRAVQQGAVNLARAHGEMVPTVADWLQAQHDQGGLQTAVHAASIDYSSAGGPLEVLTEAEVVVLGKDSSPRTSIETGQQFLRFLEDHQAGSSGQVFIDAYPFVANAASPADDDEETEYVQLFTRRVPDGGALWDALSAGLQKTPPVLPASLSLSSAARAKVLAAAQAWFKWCQALFAGGASPASWSSERMEYQFAVGARRGDGLDMTLEADQHLGGTIDWDAFEVRPGASLGSRAQTLNPIPIDVAPVPSAVTFPGMPSLRFWEFEDGGFNLAAVTAGPEDLVRLAVLDFGLIYGNDWFIVPLQVPVGTVVRLTQFNVVDTFGRTLAIDHYSDADAKTNALRVWRMYQLTQTDGTGQPGVAQSLFLPASGAAVTSGDPVEEVLFQRDDMAAMGWAIEAAIEAGSGRTLRRQEAYQRRQPAPSPPNAGDLKYTMVTPMPDYWIPLVPVRVPTPSNPAAIRLQRGAMLDPRGGIQPLVALGRILDPGHDLKLYDEEVPREGVAVTRQYSATRWTDGSQLVWVSRRKRPRRPEKPSGLRFDLAE